MSLLGEPAMGRLQAARRATRQVWIGSWAVAAGVGMLVGVPPVAAPLVPLAWPLVYVDLRWRTR